MYLKVTTQTQGLDMIAGTLCPPSGYIPVPTDTHTPQSTTRPGFLGMRSRSMSAEFDSALRLGTKLPPNANRSLTWTNQSSPKILTETIVLLAGTSPTSRRFGSLVCSLYLPHNACLQPHPGAHADIGGGSHHNRLRNSLSFLPLRWMIREVEDAKCGIVFDEKRKEDYMREALPISESPHAQDAVSAQGAANGHSAQSHTLPRYAADVFATLYDQLVLAWIWWLLEAFPLLTTYQTMDGDWIRQKVYVSPIPFSIILCVDGSYTDAT